MWSSHATRLADDGLAALTGRHGGPVTGASALITEPKEVVDYARRVDHKIDGLQDDYAQAYEVGGRAPTLADFDGKITLYTNALVEWGKKQPPPYQQWFVFRTRWAKWVSDNFGAEGITDKSFWFQNKWTLYQEIAKFDVEADEWAKTYEKLTGKKPSALVSSTPDAAAVEKKLKGTGNPDWIKWAIVAGGVGVGLYLGWPWITAIRRRRALREEVDAARESVGHQKTLSSYGPSVVPPGQLPSTMGSV